jgi:hypothetical protein
LKLILLCVFTAAFSFTVNWLSFRKVIEARVEAASYKAAYESAMTRLNHLEHKHARKKTAAPVPPTPTAPPSSEVQGTPGLPPI